MRTGQLARQGIKLRGDRQARVAFAHHRLHEHGLDEDAFFCCVVKGLLQLLQIVRLDGHQVVPVAEAGQVLRVHFAGGVRKPRRPFGASVKGAGQTQRAYRLLGMRRPGRCAAWR